MSEAGRCPECGSPLHDEFARGLCPRCLMGFGLAASGGETETASDLGPKTRVSERKNPRFSDGDDFGHFRIVRLLGQGGMGEVYEAEDLESGRRVAIKVMAHTLASDEHRERFLREGRLAASINHPNSVYVFGTEEIDGIPVISMELSPGGTLEDRIRDAGPMDPATAVDATLDLIEGLQAALDKGILHRDIKPSNCFVEADGRVKVGDYGLSISTRSEETVLTAAGTMLGTPGYASPEQLKAGDLDVRSDIYSLGATLYFLLTARPPFEETRVANLMAAILERTPDAPHQLQPKVPRALSRLVLRCLSREPADRFASYDVLREALLPFSSARSESASLRVRFVACALDYGPLGVIGYVGVLVAIATGIGTAFVSVFSVSLGLFYFSLFEGIAGQTPGKWISSIRVVGKAGPPGIPRAALRWVMFSGAPGLVGMGFWTLVQPWSLPNVVQGGIFPLFHLILLLALFATARRHNGFAGLHDMISGTRVVRRDSRQPRPSLGQDRTAPQPEEEFEPVGPYTVGSFLVRTESEEVFEGYDPTLGRRVWIRRLPDGTPPLSSNRRDLARPGRLRWLNGRRRPGENWDAYAAVDGQPLASAVRARPAWSGLRLWLLDLAAEASESVADHTEPELLASDRIWIGADGRARWLDFSVSGDVAPATDDPDRHGALAGLQRVLSEVTSTARPHGDGAHGEAPPLPLAAGRFLKRLEQSGFDSFSELLGALRSLAAADAAVRKRHRFAQILICGAFPVFLAVSIGMITYLAPRIEWIHLNELLRQVEIRRPRIEQGDNEEMIRALEIVIASRHRTIIGDPGFPTASLPPRVREQLEDARDMIDRHPSVTASDLRDAEAQLEPLFAQIEARNQSSAQVGARSVSFSMTLLGQVGLLSTALFRGGLLLGLFGMAVVNARGQPAAFWRVLARGTMVWGTVIVLFPGYWSRSFLLSRLIPFDALRRMSEAVGDYGWLGVAPSVLVITAAASWAVLHPARGLQDRLAGTYLVPTSGLSEGTGLAGVPSSRIALKRLPILLVCLAAGYGIFAFLRPLQEGVFDHPPDSTYVVSTGQLQHGDTVAEVHAAQVTAEFFAVIDRLPVLGRTFVSQDFTVGAEPVVILTYQLWDQQLGRRPQIIGEALQLDGRDHRVIGVMQQGIEWPPEVELWTPEISQVP